MVLCITSCEVYLPVSVSFNLDCARQSFALGFYKQSPCGAVNLVFKNTSPSIAILWGEVVVLLNSIGKFFEINLLNLLVFSVCYLSLLTTVINVLLIEICVFVYKPF